MVLFKSSYTLHKRPNLHLFTFHYGSIQILYRFRVKMHTIKIYIPLWFYSNLRIIIYSLVFWTFTFHYGSIQIRDNVLFFAHCYHLHSTMVLFKLIHIGMIILLLHIYIPLWFYSNQFAIHQVQQLKNLHSTMVLFKLRLQQLRRKDYFIYIPLWFYSNVCKFWKRIILKRDLHSTMVLFK